MVTFALDKSQPDYTVVVLPVNAAPDMFDVNNMLERLKSSEPKLYNKLFQVSVGLAEIRSTFYPKAPPESTHVRPRPDGISHGNFCIAL